MRKTESTREAVKEFVKEANDAEIDVVLLLEKSNKRHRMASIAFFVLAALSLVALASLVPLKDKEPYLLELDKSTGSVNSLSVLTPDQITGNEAVMDYFIRKYVTGREGYNYSLIQIAYDQTMAMSDDAVGGEYDSQFGKKDSIDKRYQGNLEVVVDNLTTSVDLQNQKAVIRFSKTFKENNREPITQYWSAELSYHISTDVMKGSKRGINPMGIIVDGYRSSQEFSR
ncbi:type IV secretion system protein [Salmonella enterica]|nr:type IV secretion system protein [Salmonella enterica subsp. enterica serovar Mbandaka]EEJ1220009.1 type IV secretion system protein [Salmonella enterica]ELK3355971.1 type IV secretion system protein [Salmonella enterica]